MNPPSSINTTNEIIPQVISFCQTSSSSRLVCNQITAVLFPWLWLLLKPVNQKVRQGSSKLTFPPSLFSDKKKNEEDLILFLLLQGYCSFKSFWLLSSECPCAPLMGLIWYSALMPSLIFVCETKCFDAGRLLKRLCVYQRLFFFPFWWRVRVLWPLTVQYTLCLLLKTRTQSIEFWIRFIIPPSSQQLCCQRAACVCMCLRERDVNARCVC